MLATLDCFSAAALDRCRYPSAPPYTAKELGRSNEDHQESWPSKRSGKKKKTWPVGFGLTQLSAKLTATGTAGKSKWYIFSFKKKKTQGRAPPQKKLNQGQHLKILFLCYIISMCLRTMLRHNITAEKIEETWHAPKGVEDRFLIGPPHCHLLSFALRLLRWAIPYLHPLNISAGKLFYS